jgi:malate/lactate dehydrogenase
LQRVKISREKKKREFEYDVISVEFFEDQNKKLEDSIAKLKKELKSLKENQIAA